MQILIRGEEDVSVRLAEELMGSRDVVVVGDEGFSTAKLERLDAEVVPGSLSSPEVLKRAGAGRADVVVACAREDERSPVAGVTAKRLGCAQTGCSVRRPEFVRPLPKDEGPIAVAIGIDAVIRPAEQLAFQIVRITGVPDALDVAILEGGRVRMRKYAVERGASVAGSTVKEAGVLTRAVLVGLRRGFSFSLPRGDTRLDPGDKVIRMGAHTRRGV